MLKIFKSKNFWLSLAHLVVAGASTTLAVMFPPAIPIIIPTQGLLNGLIPSPLNSTVPSPTPINIVQGDAVAMKEKIN